MGARKTPDEWDEWTAAMKVRHGSATGNGHGPSLQVEAQRLLPTTTATDAHSSGLGQPGHVTLTDALQRGVGLLPTPNVADGMGGHRTRSGDRSDEMLLPGAAQGMAGTWGKYGPAVAQWAAVTRPAPPPTITTAKGKQRLSGAFTEWMMGLPEGWLTDVPGLTNNDVLSLSGDGVVPQQAEAAIRILLETIPLDKRITLP